ncbi:MAG TPA: nicotinate-nucleotide adenylyltransferase [Geminicoccaceae bacterium]|nr:nicotinate-nucleotide adenylyltransferase [Geminicoccaceae bacterium]
MIGPRRPVVRIRRPIVEDAPKRAPRLRIGLLGGSFNPAHEGHLAISLEALKRLELDRVWWLVSPQNPLKPPDETADLAKRLATARRIARHPRVLVSDLERRIGTRYTVDTVGWLRKRCRARFVWLIGADNMVQLPKWRRWRRLVRMVPIAVFDREPYSYLALAGKMASAYAGRRLVERRAPALAETPPPAWVYLRLRRQQVSSTAIRQERASRRRSR